MARPGLSRRAFLRGSGLILGSAGWMGRLAASPLTRALPLGVGAVVLARPRPAHAAVVLDTNNPLANFTQRILQ